MEQDLDAINDLDELSRRFRRRYLILVFRGRCNLDNFDRKDQYFTQIKQYPVSNNYPLYHLDTLLSRIFVIQ